MKGSMKKRSILRKYCVVLALVIMANVFLVEALFAKGAVVGYVWGGHSVSDDQLENLTHIMAVDLYIKTNGELFPNPDLGSNWSNSWLTPLVNRAHQKGVQVSIVIAEGINYMNFGVVTANSTIRGTFVSHIANFVNQYNLDGVNIDWEYPSAAQWPNCISLLTDLKTALPNKRISIALSGDGPNDYPNQNYPHQIWQTVDAIHLMTYDLPYPRFPTHSDFQASKASIDAWASWGTPKGLDKEKLFMGCAFYGYKKDSNGNTLWGNANKVSYSVYFAGGNYNSGDDTNSMATKVNYCYNQGYGGVFFWHLGYDVPINNANPQSLLKATYREL